MVLRVFYKLDKIVFLDLNTEGVFFKQAKEKNKYHEALTKAFFICILIKNESITNCILGNTFPKLQTFGKVLLNEMVNLLCALKNDCVYNLVIL